VSCLNSQAKCYGVILVWLANSFPFFAFTALASHSALLCFPPHSPVTRVGVMPAKPTQVHTTNRLSFLSVSPVAKTGPTAVFTKLAQLLEQAQVQAPLVQQQKVATGGDARAVMSSTLDDYSFDDLSLESI